MTKEATRYAKPFRRPLACPLAGRQRKRDKVKQVLQSYKTGELALVDVPSPALKSGCVLVRNVASLVSAGTEKHILEMAKKSLVGKALALPDGWLRSFWLSTMKALMVNSEYGCGGAARIARTLHQAMNSLPNHKSLFAYGRGPKNQDPTAYRFAF